MAGSKNRRPQEKATGAPHGSLRSRAEEALRSARQSAEKPAQKAGAKLSAADTRALLHELQVHQVELEIQNEELRRSEATLLESRQRYFDLYHLAPVGYCSLDDAGLVTEANLTLATLFGYERGALLQHPFSRLIDPSEAEAFHLMRRRLLSQGEAQRLELRFVHRDGRPIWGLIEAALAPEADRPHACRLTVNDVTARRLVEERLRERERRYQAVTDTAHDAIITTDENGRIVDANPAAVRMFGRGMLELVNRPIGELLPRLGAGEVGLSASTGFATQVEPLIDRTLERQGVRTGDEEFPAEISLARWSAAEQRFYTFIIRDATERHRAQDQLRKLSRVVEQSPAAIVITDLMGVIIYVNPQFCLQSGYTSAEAIGANVRMLKSGETDPEVYRDLWATITAGRIWRGEFVSRTKGGERIIEKATITPVVDGAGRIVAYAGIKEDVTRRRQEAAERMELARSLQEARRLESMGLLAGGVAHEFNNILTGVIGQLEMMRRLLPAGSPVDRPITRADELCWRAAKICQQLLICAGNVRGMFSPQDCQSVVAGAVQALMPQVQDNVALTVQISDDLPPVRGNGSQLALLVTNLVLNSLDAVGDGPGAVTVSGAVEDLSESQLAQVHRSTPVSAGRYVVLKVFDTGCGMNEETKSQIFTPFFTTKFIGRGLGLAMVLGIVRSHRGALRVESALAGPTTFTVYLPVADALGTTELVSSGQA